MIFSSVNSTGNNQNWYGLAVETSGGIGSVALGRGGGVLQDRSFSGRRKHATEFIAAIDVLCRAQGVTPEQIGEVYVSHGPGSFAGLRIGVTAARMIALAHGATLVPVPTLEVIAQNALGLSPRPEHVVVIRDAKRQRVFGAAFDLANDSYLPRTSPSEWEPGALLNDQPPGCLILGEGASHYAAVVAASGLPLGSPALHVPSPVVVYRLGYALARRGATVPPRELVPLYIRPPEAEEKWDARHGR